MSKKEWKPFVVRQSSTIDDGTKSIWFGKCEISCSNPPALVQGEVDDLNCEISNMALQKSEAVPREGVEKAYDEFKKVIGSCVMSNVYLRDGLEYLRAALKKK